MKAQARLKAAARRLFHIHSPSLVLTGEDPVTSRRWVERCAICASAFATPMTREELGQVLGQIHARAYIFDDQEQ